MFTVTASKASEKLGKFLLPEPEMWVLKVVQASVRAGAEKLEFRFGRGKTLVRLVGGQAWSLVELKSTLAELGDSSPFQSELALALRSLAATHEVLLKNDKGDCMQFLDDDLSLARREPTRSCRLQIEMRPRKRNLKFHQRLRERIRNHANCARWLQSRARFAPLELRVDGRLVSSANYDCKPLKPEPVQHGDKMFEAPLLWASLPAEKPPANDQELKVAEKKILSDPLMSERFFAVCDKQAPGHLQVHLLLVANCSQSYHQPDHLEGAPFADFVWVTQTRRASFYLHFSRFGVVCDTFEARAPLGGEMHFPCDAMPAGITGLEERDEASLLPQAVEYLPHLCSMLGQLEARILEHQPAVNLPKPSLKELVAGAAFLGTLTFGFGTLGGLNVLAAGKAGLAAGGGASVLHSLRARRLDRPGVEEIAKAVKSFQGRLEKNYLEFLRVDLFRPSS